MVPPSSALQALPKISNAQVIILGTGKAKYEQLVKSMATKNPNFKGVVKFSAPMAHQITAGADFILVPSRCGEWRCCVLCCVVHQQSDWLGAQQHVLCCSLRVSSKEELASSAQAAFLY